MMDFLATETITALKKTKMALSWIEDKEHEFMSFDRLKVLRSFANFDAANLKAVCEQIDVSVADMQATLRVLTKI